MPEPATSDNPFAAPETGLLSVTDGAAPSLAGATTDGQESFYVEYEYDVDDFVEFQLYKERRNRKVVVTRFVLRVVLPLTLLAVAVSIAVMEPVIEMIPVVSTTVATALLLSWLGSESLRRRTLKRALGRVLASKGNATGTEACRASIDARGFHHQSRYSESLTRWPGVERVETSDRHVLFYVSAELAVLIPKLAFRDQGQLDAFVEAAQRYHREAEQGHG